MPDIYQQLGIIRDGSVGALLQAGTPVTAAAGAAGVNFGQVLMNFEGTKPTYSASAVALVPAASATDVLTLLGSATKTIRLVRIWISGTAGTAVNLPILLYRRPALDTGGTAASGLALPVAGAHDSNSPAATAALNAYTANPTINGTGVLLRNQTLLLPTPAAGAGGGNTRVEWEFGIRNDQAPVLRGTAQCFAINLNAVSVTTGSLNIEISWTEE